MPWIKILKRVGALVFGGLTGGMISGGDAEKIKVPETVEEAIATAVVSLVSILLLEMRAPKDQNINRFK